MKKNLHESLKISFSNFQKVNNKGHVKGVARIAYAGNNRNGSHITKSAFENAEHTLANIPIVGNWLGDNYGGHDLIMETKGNELVIKDSTVPYGVVPENCNPRWEEVEDEYGNITQYYVCDIILWHERYPDEIQFIIDNGSNQSMEIMVEDGDFNKDGYFEIDDFYYSALCILGKSDNDDDNVEPCFEDSAINVFKYSEGFESKMQQNMKEETKKGVDNMDFEKLYNELKVEHEALVAERDALAEEKEALEDKFSKLDEDFAKANEELEELRAFKEAREAELELVEKEEVVGEYADLLDEEAIAEAVNIEEMSKEEVEFALATTFATKVKAEKAKAEEEKLKLAKSKANPIKINNKYNA